MEFSKRYQKFLNKKQYILHLLLLRRKIKFKINYLKKKKRKKIINMITNRKKKINRKFRDNDIGNSKNWLR